MTNSPLEQALELHQSGKMDEAEEAYLEILANEPENAEALKLVGVLSCQLSKFDEGVNYLEAAVAFDDSLSEYHAALGHAYLAVGRINDGIESLLKAMSIDPGRADVCVSLGDTYQQIQRFPDALKAYQRAIVLEPDNIQYRIGAGLSAVFAGQHDVAAEYLKHVIAEDESIPAAHYGLSLISAEAGDRENALKHINRAFTLQPENAEYIRLRSEFDS